MNKDCYLEIEDILSNYPQIKRLHLYKLGYMANSSIILKSGCHLEEIQQSLVKYSNIQSVDLYYLGYLHSIYPLTINTDSFCLADTLLMNFKN